MCAYLHCHGKLPDGTKCGWEQDDFWDKQHIKELYEGYTPFRSDTISHLKQSLFEDRIYCDVEYFLSHTDLPSQLDDKGDPYCKGTDYVAHDLRHRANRIQNMLVKTYDEFKGNKDKLVCPRCGQQDWDID
jgi:hypothetical protein